MAKIVRPGEPWHQEVKCKGLGDSSVGCGATILITEYDIYYTYKGYMDGSHDTFKTFTCPDCGTETDIKTPIEPQGQRPSEPERQEIKKRWKEKVSKWKEEAKPKASPGQAKKRKGGKDGKENA